MFFEKLMYAMAKNRSLLCVGLDPRPETFPPEIQREGDPIFVFNRQIIDATQDLVCAYKLNYAFYEAQGMGGLGALHRTMDYIPSHLPMILDFKSGDIGSTAKAYARAAFEVWGADAVTINPYVGWNALEPFCTHKGRGVFVLCHTSNRSAGELQEVWSGGKPLYHRVAQLAQNRWNVYGNVGLVVGATYPKAVAQARALAPDLWFLLPGVGAQGGDLEAAFSAGLRQDGAGVLLTVSRGVSQAVDPREAALKLRDRLNVCREQALSQRPASEVSRRDPGLIVRLAEAGCIRFGDFLLHSGKRSPFYIDLRLLASYPFLLDEVATLYANLLEGLTFDRVAAVPYAALPIGTAVALRTGMPLIYPRREAKGYGTARTIEGAFNRGDRAVLLDDLVTTGASKLEAVDVLREAGLQVSDIVVLLDRSKGAKAELAQAGYQLHAAYTMNEALQALSDSGKISAEEHGQVLRWLEAE
ncbi:MAG: orotidine-5'-phosphate decarboxylase [Chloroflexi bacterium]|nr:orotidine-5'-phosphate decarboxylase [Chloroflexota bacterium]